MQGNNFTFIIGDRFHFRSALVTFRRIWMKDEPSNFHSCYNILWKYSIESRGLLESWYQGVKQASAEKVMFPSQGISGDLDNHKLIDLWMNAVFAHVSIGKFGDKRHQFDKCLATYGHAPMEYAFRLAVHHLGIHYRNMCDHGAEQFLKHWETQGNLKPSFQIGAPFGIKLKEITPDGHTLIRRGSTKFYNEEPIDRMFERVCSRNENRNIKSLLEQIDISASEKLKLVLWGENVEEILARANKELVVVEVVQANVSPKDLPRFRASFSFFDIETNAKSTVMCEEDKVLTDEIGLRLLNQALNRLRLQLKREAQDTGL